MTLRRSRRLVVLAVAVAMVALGACDDGSSRASLPALRPSLEGYRIDYRVEVHAQGTETSERHVQVRRPFDGRDASFNPARTLGSTVLVSNGRHLYGSNGPSVLDYGERIGTPPGDYRLQPIVADLVRLHLFDKLSRARTVAGRACTVYRTGAPLGDPFKAPRTTEYVDECVDRDGLLLAERWYLHGKLLRDTEATHVDTTVPGDDAFAPPEGDLQRNPTSFGVVEELTRTRPPKTGLPYWVAPRPPFGFALTSRVRAVSTSATTGAAQVTDLAYIDTYIRGHDAITVTHREVGAARAPARGVATVHAGALGAGSVTLSTSGASIAFTADKVVVTVQGPVDIAHLRVFAAALRRTR